MFVLLLCSPLLLLHPLEVTHHKLDLFAHLPRHRVRHELPFGAYEKLLKVNGLLLVEPVELNETVEYHLLRYLRVLTLVEQDLHEKFVRLLTLDAPRT